MVGPHDETIAKQERVIAAQRETIAELREQLAERDAAIAERDAVQRVRNPPGQSEHAPPVGPPVFPAFGAPGLPIVYS